MKLEISISISEIYDFYKGRILIVCIPRCKYRELCLNILRSPLKLKLLFGRVTAVSLVLAANLTMT